jgi:integrase
MRKHSGLILYKRHQDTKCPTRKLRLTPTAKRAYWACSCPVWIYGTLPDGRTLPRGTTGTTTLKEAEAYRDAQLSAYIKATKSSTNKLKTGSTIAECVELYIASRARDLSGRTLQQSETILNRMRDYFTSQGVLYMRDLTVDALERFQVDGLGEKADTTRATQIYKIRCFLKSAYRREWITSPLVERLSAPTATYEQKEPYSDEDVEKILNEAGRLNGGTHGFAKHPSTFRLLLELMLETGMRAGDAVGFNPAKIVTEDSLNIYEYVPQKQKRSSRAKHAEAYISDRLKKAIEGCQWLSPTLPFAYGDHKNKSYLANQVYERMQTIGERCGVADCRPHRLRDTFAIRCLLAGMHLEDVSRLLNHSSVKVTEAYYAKWTRERKIRLGHRLASTLSGNGDPVVNTRRNTRRNR